MCNIQVQKTITSIHNAIDSINLLVDGSSTPGHVVDGVFEISQSIHQDLQMLVEVIRKGVQND